MKFNMIARWLLKKHSNGIVGLIFFWMTALYNIVGIMPVAIDEPSIPPIDKKTDTLALSTSINKATKIKATMVGIVGSRYWLIRLRFWPWT